MDTNRKKFESETATLPKVDDTFGLRRTLQSDVLDIWLNHAPSIQRSEFEQAYCQML